MVTVQRERLLEERTSIDLRLIRVDERYQRNPPTRREVENLAARWNDMAASVVTLSLRDDGTYWCIDGQCRVEAARIVKGLSAQIEAQVHYGLTLAEEARLFSQLQDRKHLTVLDQFKADVLAGDPDACLIRRITTTDCGFRIGHAGGTGSAIVISAVASLYKAYRRPSSDGEGHLRTVLGILRAGDSEHSPNGAAIEGLSMFLNRYKGTADENRVLLVIQRLGLPSLERLAVGQQLSQPAISRASGFGRALLVEYNKRLSSKLDDWSDKDRDTAAMREGMRRRSERAKSLRNGVD